MWERVPSRDRSGHGSPSHVEDAPLPLIAVRPGSDVHGKGGGRQGRSVARSVLRQGELGVGQRARPPPLDVSVEEHDVEALKMTSVRL